MTKLMQNSINFLPLGNRYSQIVREMLVQGVPLYNLIYQVIVIRGWVFLNHPL